MRHSPQTTTRRQFLASAGLALGAPGLLTTLHGQSITASAIYAAVGPDLTHYVLDVARATLSPRSSVALPENVQEAWPHPTLPLLYVAWSDYPSTPARHHGVSVFRVDPRTAALTLAAPPTPLPFRPVFITLDRTGRFLFAACNIPSALAVHRIAADGSVGERVPQPDGLDFGVYGHQVRVAPSNRFMILVTRGNEPSSTAPEDPGAMKLFTFADGRLSPVASIASNGGRGFRSRHVDFHPSGRWMYLTLESQNRLLTYDLRADGIPAEPRFDTTTLATAEAAKDQVASTLHVHPNGRFVYVGNRAVGTTSYNGTPVFAGGENSIAVFAIDGNTGEPTRVENVDTHGIQPRTFVFDPTGRALVVGNVSTMARRDGERITTINATLSTFKVANDGRLTFVEKHDVSSNPRRMLFWVGALGR